MSSIATRFVSALTVALTVLISTTGVSQEAGSLPQDWADAVAWRSIGPANMGGRVTSIAVYPKDQSIWYVASASGGLLKTVNNGNDFEHLFDKQLTVSIGDVQVAATNPDIVWVGTGEANPRNSVSWGDGVYKSEDGGKTWKNMGLEKTFQTGRIAIHPENHDIVYVGSLGRLWGPNEERGLFKTTDGGKKWEKVLYVDDKTGVIDLQMNPKNSDELIVATYERERDGFDGNDPDKRFGPGAGLWKTTDGGKTFNRLTKGLPSCNLGRIGLDYWDKDPKYVIAIVESEKIAKLPENSPYLGIRGEDADAGARLTEVSEGTAAAKAGLMVNDIVLSADGKPVLDYNQLLTAVRRHQAGEKIKIEVARDREMMAMEFELDKVPEGARTGNPFTGTLGGQAENLQDQQGPDSHEYGGIYLSNDGGDSWERINTLNPRPMYYSHIRFDPQDRKNIFVCGTDLYRSFDGGKTFKADGVTDGIHVDHHALWVDPRDPRHMILGNDGGVYVTWDTMQHWDHHNHFAIGQFYHVGIDSREDYKVYGGLQDNGSWGGPARSGRDSGPVNTDWFRVGGGDGFVTTVDPNDPDQIYFESQNGGMGRVNLRTGERGFVRPRPPRGVRYRFNWKTPYVLSSHNTGIFYTAGNYVFRSLSKGDNLQAISEEITNTSDGSGSAIAESPVEAGVLYVGTTDGAVWMTKDGGQNWKAIYSKPQPKTEGAGTEEESESTGGAPAAEGESGAASQGRRGGRGAGRGSRPAGSRSAGAAEQAEVAEGQAGEMKAEAVSGETSDEAKKAEVEKAEKAEDKKAEEKKPEQKKPEPKADVLSGNWVFAMSGDQTGNLLQNTRLTMKLENDGKTLTGKLIGRRGEYEMQDGKFDTESRKFSFATDTPAGKISFEGIVEGDVVEGTGSRESDQPAVEFRYKKDKENGGDSSVGVSALSAMNLATGIVIADGIAAEENANGIWTGVVENDSLPNGRLEFTIELKVAEKGGVSGSLESLLGTTTVSEGLFNAETGNLTFTASNDDMSIDFEAKITGDTMTGTAIAAGTEDEIAFTATRKKVAAEKNAAKQEDEAKKSDAAAKPAEKSGEQKPATEDTAKEQEPATPPSPLEGTWTGKMILNFPGGGGGGGRGGNNEITMVMSRNAEGVLGGTFTTQRGDSEISEATIDEGGKFRMISDNGRFEMVFEGTVTENKMKGTIAFGENFTAEFEAEKTGEAKAVAKGDDSETAKTGTLESFLPGPRWVSSLTASKYKAGRVYVSLDGHRSNDDEPYMFVSEDYGETWKSIRGNLPTSAGSVLVLREDIRNENILYAGCEFSAWVSIDAGLSWTRFGKLPTVAVHEFAQHPTLGDVVAATHGRSLWVADMTALRQFSVDVLARDAVLYQPAKVIRWQGQPGAGDSGTRRFVGENPPSSATIHYSLGANTRSIELEILGADGRVLRRFEELGTDRGLHSVTWDLREEAASGAASGGRGGRGGGGRGFGRTVAPGDYQVRLVVNGDEQKKLISVVSDPALPAGASLFSSEDLREFAEQFSEDEVGGGEDR